MRRIRLSTFTEQGVKKVRNSLILRTFADPENEIQHNIILALRAHNLMHRDQDYVVKDDEVMIVDEFTGRIMPERAIRMVSTRQSRQKKSVKVKRESKTLQPSPSRTSLTNTIRKAV